LILIPQDIKMIIDIITQGIKMGVFTNLTKDEANEILALYDLGPLESIKALGLGISNSNFKVKLKDRFILLKVSDDKGEKELIGEQKILHYLKDKKFPYSICPLELTNGDTIYHHKGKIGVIFEFLEGIPPGPSDDTCYEIGQALALLHSLKKDESYLELRSHEEVGFGGTAVKGYINQESCPEDFKEIFHKIFPDSLEAWQSSDFEEGVIHGDLYYDNTLFHNNRLNVVLDFEQSGRGKLLFDVGISISGTCLEKGTIGLRLIDSFLMGYESIRPLPEAEKEYLNQAILLALFSIALWRIKRFKEGDLDRSRENSYQELLSRALNYFNLLEYKKNEKR
jgi:homoserine kinase type II